MIAYAATIDDFLDKINAKIINPAIEFAFIVALVVFLFGVMEFIRGASNDKKRTDGKQHMLWGLIGFVIMFGVWGIINILLGTFGIQGGTFNQKQQTFDPPCIQNIQIDGKDQGSLLPCK